MGSFVFTPKVVPCMHAYILQDFMYYDYNSQDNATGGESRRRRLKRLYCTHDVPGTSVDEAF